MNRKIILLGQESTKRTLYFMKAANALDTNIEFYELGGCIPSFSESVCMKIDPPQYKDSDIFKVNGFIDKYMCFLEQLGQKAHMRFLNHPKAIVDTLDKKQCKDILKKQGVETTPMINETFSTLDGLRAYLIKNKEYRVFIKPRYGSGAAGIIAYKVNPKTGQDIIYTSVILKEGRYINTKRIRKIAQPDHVKCLVEPLLKTQHIVETWVEKPRFKDITYDLRVVYQFGKIEYIVARGSKMPMTNLHLNNHAIDFDELRLSQEVLENIEEICEKAVQGFEGLNSVGIDILLKGKAQTPVIIEMNSQGDLIYKDIYDENNIYKEQIRRMINNEV